jgi:hypothetical protein
MVFQLLVMAERRWRRVNAPGLAALVRAGVGFRDGTAVARASGAQAA